MKKYLCLLLICSLAFLASCGGCKSCKSNRDGFEVDLNVDLSNKIDLNVIYPNSGMPDSTFKSGYTTEIYQNLTGYKVNYNQILDTDTSKVITNILTTRDAYHLLKLEGGIYGTEYRNGSFCDLSQVLEKYGQNLLRVIPQQAWDAVTSEDGKIYAVPECGFSGMLGFALVWNKEHLSEVGITKLPETIGEVTEAFNKLQEHYSKENNRYHAFAMQGSQAYVDTLAVAFDLPKDFYVNDQGKIEHVMYHPNYEPYMKWLHNFKEKDIITAEWQSYTGSDVLDLFVKGNISCGYIPYWNMVPLYNSLAAQKSLSYDEAKKLVDWSLYIRGDGTNGSVNQTKARYMGGNGINYYNVVPVYMAKFAAYVVDWMDKRITEEAYKQFYLGVEGIHYNVVDQTTPNAYEFTLGDDTQYIVTTDRFQTDILPNSMYATGGNPEVALACWGLRDRTYDAWSVCVDNDAPECIRSPFEFTPYIKGWSEIDIASRSWVITYEQQAINGADEAFFNRVMTKLKSNWKTKYWTDEVDQNVQAWYSSISR